MELARVTTHGQITIPINMRKKLGVRDGDKIVFFEENGRIFMENSAAVALCKAQAAFVGEASRLGIETEEDVVAMVKAVRQEVWEEKHASNG